MSDPVTYRFSARLSKHSREARIIIIPKKILENIPKTKLDKQYIVEIKEI